MKRYVAYGMARTFCGYDMAHGVARTPHEEVSGIESG
jgi:hypothetical protein